MGPKHGSKNNMTDGASSLTLTDLRTELSSQISAFESRIESTMEIKLSKALDDIKVELTTIKNNMNADKFELNNKLNEVESQLSTRLDGLDERSTSTQKILAEQRNLINELTEFKTHASAQLNKYNRKHGMDKATKKLNEAAQSLFVRDLTKSLPALTGNPLLSTPGQQTGLLTAVNSAAKEIAKSINPEEPIGHVTRIMIFKNNNAKLHFSCKDDAYSFRRIIQNSSNTNNIVPAKVPDEPAEVTAAAIRAALWPFRALGLIQYKVQIVVKSTEPYIGYTLNIRQDASKDYSNISLPDNTCDDPEKLFTFFSTTPVLKSNPLLTPETLTEARNMFANAKSNKLKSAVTPPLLQPPPSPPKSTEPLSPISM